MTNKEYREAVANAEFYTGYDMLNREEISELAADIRDRKRYNRAFVLEGFNTRASIREQYDGVYVLTSYYTDVALIHDGKLYRLWDGWSKTTAKHVNIFCEHFGLTGLNKREWIEKEVTTIPDAVFGKRTA